MAQLPMVNLYEDVRSNLRYNKFHIDDLLFAEYTCPIEADALGIWAETDYIVHVVSGKKVWHTTQGVWAAESGQTLFFKKGAAIVEQFFYEDFCLILFFVPDNFVRDVLRELEGTLPHNSTKVNAQASAIRVSNDVALSAYFQSMLAYFSGEEKPSEHLLKLKLKELIVSILVSESNPELSAYFRSLNEQDKPLLTEIMEANFRFNLSMEEFAEMCHRSLSSFKRDFRKTYNESPGRWLLNKRLDFASVLLKSSDTSVSQVAFECGFEDLSHFSKAFRQKLGISPTDFRKESEGVDPVNQTFGLLSKAHKESSL